MLIAGNSRRRAIRLSLLRWWRSRSIKLNLTSPLAEIYTLSGWIKGAGDLKKTRQAGSAKKQTLISPLVSAGFRAVEAATANPSDSLGYEGGRRQSGSSAANKFKNI
jgi:hypothetical protein